METPTVPLKLLTRKHFVNYNRNVSVMICQYILQNMICNVSFSIPIIQIVPQPMLLLILIPFLHASYHVPCVLRVTFDVAT